MYLFLAGMAVGGFVGVAALAVVSVGNQGDYE